MYSTLNLTHPLSLTRDMDTPALDRHHPWGEPRHPGAMASSVELCQHWQDMDAYHSTPVGSPLHHDWRCEGCFPPDCDDCEGPGIRRTSGRQAGTVLCPEDFAARQRQYPSFY